MEILLQSLVFDATLYIADLILATIKSTTILVQITENFKSIVKVFCFTTTVNYILSTGNAYTKH